MGNSTNVDIHFVLAGGGTGGHLYPGIAVAEAIRAQCPNAVITFFSSDRDIDRQMLEPKGFRQIAQPVKPITSRPWHWPSFLLAWQRSVAMAKEFIRTNKPRAVLGLGGFAAGPAVVAAAKLGVPSAILNPDAVPGRANRFLAKRADRVFCQWAVDVDALPIEANVEIVGCPIRSTFFDANREDGARLFGLDPSSPVLLVTGASQGARTVNQAVTAVWPDFSKRNPEWQILHLTGNADFETVKAQYNRAGASACVVDFTHDMPLALATADVVVSRSGASTLAELTALGLPAILLPYPYHRDQHQRANGQILADAGAAILLEDHRDAARNAGPLSDALRRLADEKTRRAMADASRQIGRLDAADQVAQWLITQN